MRSATAILIGVVATLQAAWGAPECLVPTGEYTPTQVPYTYVLDRRGMFTEEYLARYETGAPSLLECGGITPGHPYFGPLCDLAALREGREEKSVEEFIQEYRENAEKTRVLAQRARAAGVKTVCVYVCMITTGGDPEARTGFWRFYDNWDAFSEFNIPPKPEVDPQMWQQRHADGSPVIAYRRAHLPYQPMFRYTNCVNNPGWQTYHRWVTEEAARIGIDGFFVDNASTHWCYCQHCQSGFERWIRSRYSEAEIQELFGGDLSLQADRSAGDLRLAETDLFWQESIHNFLAKIRKWGSDIRGKDFFVFPNGLHQRTHFIATRFRDCDLAMDENSSGDFGGHPGVAKVHIVAGFYARHVNDDLLTYKYASGIGARCRANLLSYSGHPEADAENLGPNPNVGALGMAEPAAFGGGGCYAPIATYATLAPVRETFNQFFEANADLYRGKYPFGQVAIMAPVLPNYFGDRSTFGGVDQALHTLLDGQALTDLVPESIFGPAWIARYAAIVVPHVPIMSDSQVRALIDYAKAGGTLVMLGNDVARRDQLGRDRSEEDRQELLDAADARYEQDLDLPESIEEGGVLSGLELCDRQAAPLVRFAGYVDDPFEPTELILHCVNYDVALGTEHDRVGAVNDLKLAIPLPPNTRAVSAVLKAPGKADVELTVEGRDGRAAVVLPSLRIYAIVRISLERGGAR